MGSHFVRVVVALAFLAAAATQEVLPSKEIAALNELYTALGGAMWPPAERWDVSRMGDSGYLCSAPYVTCESKPGVGLVVTKLFSQDHNGTLSRPCDLAFRRISGTIPESVFTDLTHLTTIGAPSQLSEVMIDADAAAPAPDSNVPFNNVHLPAGGVKPSRSLRVLSVCGFFGDQPMPHWFVSGHNWTHFEAIHGPHTTDVSGLGMSGSDARIQALSLRGSAGVSGVATVRKLRHLTALDLGSIPFGVDEFPAKSELFSSLVTGPQFYANMSGSHLRDLPTWRFATLPRRVILDFSDCGASTMPGSLVQPSDSRDAYYSTVDVNLSHNKLDKLEHSVIGGDAQQPRPLLRIINLSHNHRLVMSDVIKFLGKGNSEQAIESAHARDRDAMTLDISHNGILTPSATECGRIFGFFKRLIISFNKITDFHCSQDRTGLHDFTSMLDISYNSLEFIGTSTISGLKHIDVSHNSLHAHGVWEQASDDCKDHVDISYNGLSRSAGRPAGELAICARNIFAAGNEFSSMVLKTEPKYPPGVRVMPTVVDVSHNRIKDPFWTDPMSSGAIVSLSISDNLFSGASGVVDFTAMGTLLWLEAARNKFSGRVLLPRSGIKGLNILGNDVSEVAVVGSGSDDGDIQNMSMCSMCAMDNPDALGSVTSADACRNAKSVLCPHIDLPFCRLFPGCEYLGPTPLRPARCVHVDVTHHTLQRVCTKDEMKYIEYTQDNYIDESCIAYVGQTPTIDPSCYPGYSAVGSVSVDVAMAVAAAFVVNENNAVVLDASDRRNKAIWTNEGVKRVRNCQKGFFCPKNLKCAVMCQEGSYCPSPNDDVNDFLDGMDVATYSGEDDAGSAMSVPCKRGYYCPSTTCREECPSGYFCLEGVTAPKECVGMGLQACPAGSHRPMVGISGWLLYLGIIVFHTVVCFSLQCCHWVYRSLTDKGKLTRMSNRLNWLMHFIKDNEHRAEEYPIIDMILPRATSESPAESQPVNIEFERLSLHVGSKCILQSVSGALRPQRLTALMGPSGAGKTTLLNVLSSKASYGKSSGTVRINGKLGDLDSIRSVMGFVPQDDILHGNMTCYENIQRSRLLFGPSIEGVLDGLPVIDDPHSGTNAILHSLRIAHVADTIVGTTENRGVSGGQRKRVSIGMELAKKPKVLFLDEPTSGLDSTTSLEIVKELKHIAQTRNMTVAAVIHQPRADLMELFDDVVLLAPGGETVYVGPVNEIEDYFRAAGFLYSGRGNIADFILDVVSGSIDREIEPVDVFLPRSAGRAGDGRDGNVGLGIDSADGGAPASASHPIEMQDASLAAREAPLKTPDEYASDAGRRAHHATDDGITAPLLPGDEENQEGVMSGVLDSDASDDPVKFLTRRWKALHGETGATGRVIPPGGVGVVMTAVHGWRTRLSKLRVRRRKVVRSLVHLVMCLWYALVQETRAWRVTMMHGLLAVVGSCLLGTLSQDLKEEGVVSAINMLLLLSALSGCMASLRVFGDEKEVYWREAASGLFRPSYFLAKDAAVASMVMYVPLTITLGYKLSAHPCNAPWLAYYWPIMLIYACGVGSGYVLSIAVKMSVGQVGGITLWLIAGMLSGGGTVTLNDMDSLAGVLVSSLSPIRWALEVLVCREFRQWPSITSTRTNKVIDHIGFKKSREALDMTMLVVYVFALRLVAMAALRLFHRGKQV